MKSASSQSARFDTRLTLEQKNLFEQAASLGGFRTLTEFIIFSVQEKAKSIISEHATILSSKKDKDIFFDALVSPAKPNKQLKAAAKKYKGAATK